MDEVRSLRMSGKRDILGGEGHKYDLHRPQVDAIVPEAPDLDHDPLSHATPDTISMEEEDQASPSTRGDPYPEAGYTVAAERQTDPCF